ncbi:MULTISPECIES: DUF4244 domain-containing protein [Actinoplanes]|uniref:DUF4244 domain-containing protein n=1 Tax=Actinoplanes TaxID=1865 RepID=UPI000ADE522E|nr:MULTISPECIES: DUF4244 domain-containing protein [Actinoplanes]GLY05867.1 hypothetical protein Acsp01_62460 [Actinoplanes sp. NBRC 101535]
MYTLIANYRRLRTEASDTGMSTVEYALGTVAAGALATVLFRVVTGGDVTAAITAIVLRALK